MTTYPPTDLDSAIAILTRLRAKEAEERRLNRLPYADELKDEILLIESLSKDADRYRWLRKALLWAPNYPSVRWVVYIDMPAPRFDPMAPEEYSPQSCLDAGIDQALSQSNGAD